MIFEGFQTMQKLHMLHNLLLGRRKQSGEEALRRDEWVSGWM